MTTEENSSSTQARPELRVAIIRSLGVVVSLVAIVVCSYLLFNLFKDSVEIPLPGQSEQQQPQTEEEQKPISAETSAQSTTDVVSQAVPEVTQPPLPELNDSDKEIRSAASKLNQALKWADWITTDEAIRKFVVVIDNLAAGKIAAKYLPIPKPNQRFKSSQEGVKTYLDKASFERYNPYVSLFENIDNDMASALYQRYSPLMEQAFAELGYADRSFHDTLMQAFDVLLSAPIVNDDIELIRPSVIYKFADSKLERALPAHKQLIRMGPKNTQKLQAKIRQLQAVLSPAN